MISPLRKWTVVISACLAFAGSSSYAVTTQRPAYQPIAPHGNEVTPLYCQQVLTRVDAEVSQQFFNRTLAQTTWKESMVEHREQILASKNLIDLESNINQALLPLGAGHAQLLTINDESYYFLHSLFANHGNRNLAGRNVCYMDFTGAIVGGGNCLANQVRYVLDGSPAATAGVKPGDVIEKVSGEPFLGQLNFIGRSGQMVGLTITRKQEVLRLTLVPKYEDTYAAYVKAIMDSERITDTKSGKIGYVHLWTGGKAAKDVFDYLLSHALNPTNGLIVDLRDGYGACSFDYLDSFYRPAKGYPADMVYDKPLIVLVNGAVRGGKELLPYSLKQTGRATLVGERTAGLMLGEQLFPIDNRCALYLATKDRDIPGIPNLEGVGVSPDIQVANGACTELADDKQLAEATRVLSEKISQ